MWERLTLVEQVREQIREVNLKRPKLKIKIHEAANLPPMDLVNGLADAYVIIKIWIGSYSHSQTQASNCHLGVL